MEQELFQHLINQFREKHGEVLEIKSYNALGGGCINNALKLDTNHGPFFLKWNASGPNDLFEREAESLAEFHKSNNDYVLFPKPLLHKEIDSSPGYLLTDYLQPGSSKNRDERMGYGLSQLHKVTNDEYGFYHDNYCGETLQNNTFKTNWFDFYVENRVGHLISLIEKYRSWDDSDQLLFEDFIQNVEWMFNYDSQPSLIHGDLWSGNYMDTEKGPAFIDPAASYCDREFEMGIMTMFGGFSQRVFDAYNEAFPLDDGWRERNLVYQLYHVLNHYLIFGGGYKQQALEIMRRYF
ncbi:MAG: fructosamine kinase family protein [Prolixibacteraceae bacterium]|jgi:protein-ribulosamine 3-kinase|nr:fructosamine kinase family protein [Prolixibacteraceae bacterium]